MCDNPSDLECVLAYENDPTFERPCEACGQPFYPVVGLTTAHLCAWDSDPAAVQEYARDRVAEALGWEPEDDLSWTDDDVLATLWVAMDSEPLAILRMAQTA